MSATVEVFVMCYGEIFSQYFGVEDGEKLFLKKDPLGCNLGPDYCVIHTMHTQLSHNSATIYPSDIIRKIHYLDMEAICHSLPANDPHLSEIEAYSRRRYEIWEELRSTIPKEETHNE